MKGRTDEAEVIAREALKKLEELQRDLSSDSLAKIIHCIEAGKAYKEEALLLLHWFCQSAQGVRTCMHDASHTPDLVEFVASRINLFLCGKESSLMRAFCLERSEKGPTPKRDTQRRGMLIAVQVCDLMESGKSLDEAAEIVAAKEGVNESTVRNWYVEHKESAKMLQLYQYLFYPKFLSSED